MAIYNEILAPRLSRFLQKFLSMKGAPGMKQLAGELMPTISMSSGNENKFLEGWVMHSWLVNMAASAANLNAAMLRNPVGSNIIAVFVKVTASANVATPDGYFLSMGPRTTDLPTASPIPAPSNFDRRFSSTARSLLIGSIQQAAGPGTAPPDRAAALVVGDGTYDFVLDQTEEFPLLPGDAVSIRNAIVNQGSLFTFWWRERVMEDSELFG